MCSAEVIANHDRKPLYGTTRWCHKEQLLNGCNIGLQVPIVMAKSLLLLPTYIVDCFVDYK